MSRPSKYRRKQPLIGGVICRVSIYLNLMVSEVMLLIASDMAHLLIHLEVRQGRVDEPIAINTPLGWTLFGNANKELCEVINANLLATNEALPLEQQIERFWEVDSYEMKQAPSEATLSVED